MYQHLVIVGNVGRTPELRTVQSGDCVLGFSLAVSEWKKSDDPANERGFDEIVTWYRTTVWGDTARRLADRIHKGDRVLVEGIPAIHLWKTREGEQRAELEVKRARVKLVAPKAPISSPTAGVEDDEEDEPVTVQEPTPIKLEPTPIKKPVAMPARGSGRLEEEDFPF